ncbi:PKD domain-containing protein [Methylomagnum ishizawai]|uniref:PKD domain-containing protein n=1 Tax=Methylomagnum ishizawai TaxID=1760988 RepID=UPI001C31FD81|nr:PKD domain-containing protein [Methylomagnum ishizawai]BBL74924.1 hypothetical protein MishRS11D_20220 [Methylomagnum ishizawai]
MTADTPPMKYRWTGLLTGAFCWTLAGTATANTLNDGVTLGTSGLPSPGDTLVVIVDTATGASPNQGKTLLVNTHWRYSDLVKGTTVPQFDLSADPNYLAISQDPLTFNLVAAYALYQNPDNGKANLDQNGVELPFDDSIDGNAQWGLVVSGTAADIFSTDVNDINNTLNNGVQSYWNAVNTALAGAGATPTAGTDTVLIGPDDAAAWDAASWNNLGGSGIVVGNADGTGNTAIAGAGTEGQVFWITNPSLQPGNPNAITPLGTIQLTQGGQLVYVPAGGEPPPPPTNHPPEPKIAAPDTAVTGTPVALDGSASTDPDRNNTLSYAWTQTGGPATVNLGGADTATASFKATAIGNYSFSLTVTDNHGASASASVTVTITPPVNHPPVANATPAQATVNTGTLVTLDGGTSTDPDAGDSLAYRWEWVSGPATPVLNGADSASARFKAEVVGAYVFKLTVIDNHGASASATAAITVDPNHAPVARASADARVGQGAAVVLDGSGSSDPDGDALVYAWIPLAGPTTARPDPADAAVARFTAAAPGIYRFKLIVADGLGADASTEVQVKAGPGVVLNAPTTWLAGRAQTIAITGFQLGNKAKVALRFSPDGRRFKPLARVSLKKGTYLWKPGKRDITRQGVIQACQDIKNPASCDEVSNISVQTIPGG